MAQRCYVHCSTKLIPGDIPSIFHLWSKSEILIHYRNKEKLTLLKQFIKKTDFIEQFITPEWMPKGVMSIREGFKSGR